MKNYLQLVSSGEAMSFNNQMNKRMIKTPEEIGKMIMDGIIRLNCNTISLELKDMIIKYIRLSTMRMSKETLPKSDQAYIINLIYGNTVKLIKLMYFNKEEYHALWNAIRTELINTGYLPDPNVIIVDSKKKINKSYPPLEGIPLPNKPVKIC